MANEFTSAADSAQQPVTIFGPDFPFPFDDWIAHPAGLGSIPQERLGEEVAIVGAGISGMVAALRTHETGPAARRVRGFSHGWPVAFATIRGCADRRDRRAGRNAFPGLVDRVLSLRRSTGASRLRRFPTRLRPHPTARLSILKARRITPSSPTHCRRYSRRWPRLGPMRWRAWGSPGFRMRSGPVMLRP